MKIERHRAPGVPWNDTAELALRRAVRQIEARAERYPEYWTELEIRVEDARDGAEAIHLELVLSGHEIVVDRAGEDPASLVQEAFQELFRRFDLYRLETNRTLRERVERRLERKRLAPVTASLALPEGHSEGTTEALELVYPTLLRIAQHEIAVRQIEGDLEPGLVDPIEALDTVVAEVAPEVRGDLTEEQVVSLFQERLLSWLDDETQELLDHRETDLSLDQRVAPEEPLDFGVSPQGDDIRDFWVMEEELHREDLFADAEGIDPEGLWAEQEYRNALVHALFGLEHEVRRLFSQVVIDGWAQDAIAAALQIPESEVVRQVDEAAHDLARRLSRGGTPWSADRVREVYRALGEQLEGERRSVYAEV